MTFKKAVNAKTLLIPSLLLNFALVASSMYFTNRYVAMVAGVAEAPTFNPLAERRPSNRHVAPPASTETANTTPAPAAQEALP